MGGQPAHSDSRIDWMQAPLDAVSGQSRHAYNVSNHLHEPALRLSTMSVAAAQEMQLRRHIMSSRIAALVAPIAMFFGTGIASAAPHGGHGGHGGHAGGAQHGAYHGGYYGGHHHNNGWAVGIGIGLGLGYGYGGYGGYGYPYYGGYSYPAYPDYGYADPVAPAEGGYYTPPADGNYAAPATYTAPATNGNGNVTYPATTASAPATFNLVVPAGAKVWFDGKEASDTEGKRVFTSPAIEPGQSQALSVKVEMNGSTSQMRVPLRAGDNMTMDLRR